MSSVAQDKIRREMEFHDEWAKGVDLNELLVRESFESPTAIENRYALEQLGDLRGKKILDMGCGAGESSVFFALKGAEVTACDISSEFLKVAQRLAAKNGVSIQTVQSDSAHMPYPDASFDYVFGNGVLHHVELLPTVAEISRLLKPGGKAVFVEPLPYNPVINVYRHMAKAVRTEDEKPLTRSQVQSLKKYFSCFEHQEFWFFSLLIFFHFFFVRRWHPGKVRYWKKVIEEGPHYQKSFAKLQKMDAWVQKYGGPLRYLCWNTVIVGIK